MSTRKPSTEELTRAHLAYKAAGCRHVPRCDGGWNCIGRMVQEERQEIALGQADAVARHGSHVEVTH